MKKVGIVILMLLTVLQINALSPDENSFFNELNRIQKDPPKSVTQLVKLINLHISNNQRTEWRISKTFKFAGSVINSNIGFVRDFVYFDKYFIALCGFNSQDEYFDKENKIQPAGTIYTDAIFIPVDAPFYRVAPAWEKATGYGFDEKNMFGVELAKNKSDFFHARSIVPYCVIEIDVITQKIKGVYLKDSKYRMENEVY